MGSVLAVDFGTSTTVAMVRRPDGRVETVLFDGSPTLPSAVFAPPGARLLTGHEALASARAAPERCEPHPKLRIEDSAVWLGAEVTVVEMIGAVFARVAAEAGPADRVVLTHPASWTTTRLEVLLRAAAHAGLPPVTLLPEPVAAARYFAEHEKDVVPGGPVAVYDFGAGTFDVSVVAGDRVLAADGLGDLGGLDIDEAIVELLDGTIEADDEGREAWSRLRSPRGPVDRRAWRSFCEHIRTAKEMLSRTSQALLHIPLVERDVPLDRKQLEAIAEPLIRRTVATTRAAMTTAGLTGATGVYVVGGASRMPLVGVMLERILGIPAVTAARPELTVAHGAALVATDPDPLARGRLLTRAAGSMRALARARTRELAERLATEPTVVVAAAPIEPSSAPSRPDVAARPPAPPSHAPAKPEPAKPATTRAALRADVWLLLGLIAAVAVGATGVVVLLWKVASG